MGKKSTNVKTYELRQNDLCIMLKQLKPVSNKNYGTILHKLRQFVRICICCKRLQRNYRGKRVKCRMNHRKQTHKFGNAKNVRKRTSFAHSCIICNGKKCSMLKNIRDGKICAKNGMEIAAHKTYLVYAAFWCSENCAAKCWKQKWHKSGAARLGSGFCAIYVVIYLRQYRIILSADTASEVRQMLSQKRR